MITEAQPLTEAEARRIRATILRLYRVLEAFPGPERPEANTSNHGSPAYWAVAAEIRSYADQYRAHEASREAGEKCRMVRAELGKRD